MSKKLLALTLILSLLLAACGSSQGSVAAPAGDGPAVTPAAQSAGGDDWPNRMITIICVNPAGGSADLMCRLVANKMSEKLGVNVIVENITGSGGWIGWSQMLNSIPKDGYTICNVNLSTALGQYRDSDPIDATIEDFALLGNHAYDSAMIGVRLDENRFTDFPSLVAYAQENEILTATNTTTISSGAASIVKWMEQELGCKIINVPIEGAADEIQLLHSGNIDIRVADVGDAVRDPEMRAIVTFGDQRSEFLSDVPTGKELGYEDFQCFSCRGYAYAKGVDQAIVDKMTAVLEEIINDPEIVKIMSDNGVETIYYAPEDQLKLIDDVVDEKLALYGIEKK